MAENLREEIIDLLVNKAAIKQDIADYSEEVFALFKQEINNEIEALKTEVDDTRIRLKCKVVSNHEFRLYIGSDVLVFQLHRNVFRLPDEHPLWETDYLKQNGANAYFGVINIYNFLAESFEQRRLNDVGYLISRVFVNHDKKCMVEGKVEELSLFENLEDSVLTEEMIQNICQKAIAFSIEFDLITPPYELIQEISFQQIQEISSNLQVATGKRLGFKFSADDKNLF